MAKYAARGILLQIGDGAATEVFTTIPGVIAFRGPGRRRATLPAGDHDTSGFEEYLVALIDSGELSFTAHWDPDHAQHEALEDDFAAGTLRNFQVDYTTNTAIVKGPMTFAAYVTQLEADHPSDGKLTVAVTLKVSGAVGGLT